MEPTGLDSSTDRTRSEPDGEQLRPAHDSVLMAGERRDRRVRAKVSLFDPHSGMKSETLVHGADHRATNATEHHPSMPT
jgi:hypothetical protein